MMKTSANLTTVLSRPRGANGSPTDRVEERTTAVLAARIPSTHVYDVHVFKAILNRERALAYRHGRPFALLELNMNNGNRNRRCMDELARTLSRRVRTTDVIGFSDVFSMAAILPETSADGAEQVATELCDQIASFCTPPEFSVHLYPDTLPRASCDGQADATAKAAHQVGAEDGDVPVSRVDSILFKGPPIWKRVFDIMVTVPFLIAVSPLMLLVALLIKCVSPGPVLFKQERIGFLGRSFTLYKFRTMHCENHVGIHQAHVEHLIASDAPMKKLDCLDDPRIIPLGYWIRAAALDELPQLFNVLQGDMSLVGPRPPIKYEFDCYAPWHRRRCDAMPGLTGGWQVSGKNYVSFSRMVRQDINYVDHGSLWTDVKTICLTFPAVLRGVRAAATRVKTVRS